MAGNTKPKKEGTVLTEGGGNTELASDCATCTFGDGSDLRLLFWVSMN